VKPNYNVFLPRKVVHWGRVLEGSKETIYGFVNERTRRGFPELLATSRKATNGIEVMGRGGNRRPWKSDLVEKKKFLGNIKGTEVWGGQLSASDTEKENIETARNENSTEGVPSA